jgi:hypothetical protein
MDGWKSWHVFSPSLVLSYNIIHNLILYLNQIYWIEFLHPGAGLRPSMVIPYGITVGADTMHLELYHGGRWWREEQRRKSCCNRWRSTHAWDLTFGRSSWYEFSQHRLHHTFSWRGMLQKNTLCGAGWREGGGTLQEVHSCSKCNQRL